MKIVIVGGGITGWLSALIFSHRQPNHKYVIVESPEIDTIGVGAVSYTHLTLPTIYSV